MSLVKSNQVFPGHAEYILCMALFPDQHRLVFDCGTDQIKLLNLVTHTIDQIFEGFTESVEWLGISPDNTQIIHLGRSPEWYTDTIIIFWNISTGQMDHRYQCHGINTINVLSDNTLLIDRHYSRTACDDGILILNMNTMDSTCPFTTNTFKKFIIPNNNDQKKPKIIGLNNHSQYHMIDISTGEPLQVFQQHVKPYSLETQACILPNNRLAIGYTSGQIVIWTNQGVVHHTLLAHTDEVCCLTCTHHGRQIISGGCDTDGTIKIWEVDTETECLITAFEGHVGGVTGLSTYANGSKLISTGEDGLIKCWNLK